MVLLFLTIMRMFATGVSGAPLSAVVRKVASSAGVPLPSKATAASVNGLRFSIKLSTGGVGSCALTQRAPTIINKLTAIVFIIAPLFYCQLPISDCQLKEKFKSAIGNWKSAIDSFADHRIHELVDRLTILGNALSQTSFKLVTRFFQHSRRRAIPFKHMRVQATDLVIQKRIFRHGDQRLGRNTSTPKLLAQPAANP